MIKIIILYFLVATVLGYSRPISPSGHFDGRIVGGKPVDIKDRPYQLSVQLNGVHRCSAVVVDDKHAITTAHCINGIGTNPLTIRAGSSKINSGGEVISVEKVTKHPLASDTKHDYDIAVIKLSKSLGSLATPVLLPTKDDVFPSGTKSTVSGWGTVKEQGKLSEELRQATIDVVSQPVCRDIYLPMITERMICSGLPLGGSGPCDGDQGSPLTEESTGKLIGLASFGLGCARPNYPGVYTRVSSFLDFIKQSSN